MLNEVFAMFNVHPVLNLCLMFNICQMFNICLIFLPYLQLASNAKLLASSHVTISTYHHITMIFVHTSRSRIMSLKNISLT